MTNELDVVPAVAMFDTIDANRIPIGRIARPASVKSRVKQWIYHSKKTKNLIIKTQNNRMKKKYEEQQDKENGITEEAKKEEEEEEEGGEEE